MPSQTINVRPARRSDGEAIFPWTQNTFSWGDYIPRIWYDWYAADDGALLVAEVDDRIVGNLHVAWLGQREGWMEGMRVHPDYRKRGVATALDRAGQQAARAAGCRVVRLETAATNLPAQSAVVTYGYRRLAQVLGWEADSLEGVPSRARRARPRDLSALYRLWLGSAMRLHTRGLTALAEGWRWAELTRARLQAFIAHDAVWVTPVEGTPKGFAITRWDDEDMGVVLLVGRAGSARDLLSALRQAARQAGYPKLYLILPAYARESALARKAGFTSEDHTMLIYECQV